MEFMDHHGGGALNEIFKFGLRMTKQEKRGNEGSGFPLLRTMTIMED
ncbi:uncharacterized protein G2W53_024066 [Senna tora]|uniref:Uncharacterized protein n=1 Tax=Senna tora TaxID=362788 RepID=A0A834TCH4_9FABA|nr:uncharacterized protein G2W53_024066 [Senna tora]